MWRAGTQEAVWAAQTFGEAALGDARRTARLVRLAAAVAENPGGKVSAVVRSARELDAAYDLLESKYVGSEAMAEAMGRATARRSVGTPYVWVAIDGSSVHLVDRGGEKDFGRIGTVKAGARGLKVISALAVDPAGVTLGLLSQRWWARIPARSASAKIKRRRRETRRTEEKETAHWIRAIEQAACRLDETDVRGWFQIDREGDAWPILTTLLGFRGRHLFSVRAAWDRVVESTGRDRQYLRAHLSKQRPIGRYGIEVSARPGRAPRRAQMVMRCAEVTLRLKDRRTGKPFPMRVHVVWVREQRTTPQGEKPLDWLILTNAPVESFQRGRQVVLGYAARWRIEEFHRAWKSGVCHVEDTQLRSRDAVVRWATLLASVAARVERIKLLARGSPERPASDEFSDDEIRVLILMKREQKKRTETVPDGVPTMAQATRWIADLGGYTGKSSGGPPGSITIQRGLERVEWGARVLHAAEHLKK